MPRTATVTSVSAATSSTQLVAANAAVSGRLVYNDSAYFLYLKYGTAASTTSFTHRVDPFDLFEFPDTPLYDGVVHGIWGAASGAARCTEVV